MATLAYLQVARICNQKCLFCSNPENGRVISWKEATDLVDSFTEEKAAGVIITGGEPTLFDRLPELVAYALKKGLPPRLITNGQRVCKLDYLKALVDAGLDHMHISVHSAKAEVQGELTGNKNSLPNILRALENAGKLGVRVDINTVINSRNAGHLSFTPRFLVSRFPFLNHFVWNNLDPLMNAASLNPELVPKLRSFEVELHRAMTWLTEAGKSFRVERVPLCFMSDFGHFSTETRKFIKDEGRDIYFLDEKGRRQQDKSSWSYGKAPRCKECSVEAICAGLYQMDVYYSSSELCPILTPAQAIIAKVKEEAS
ncbi:MAG: radical SAM protein [Elusimicrobia bacterium]|nr:radical SAM protein [Elusimicrobiota bacterium]